MKSRYESQILLYQTEDGKIRLEVQLENETVWLTQNQMAELFQTSKQNVSLHIQNFFTEGGLQAEATVKESLTVRKEGNRKVSRAVEFYNLDGIISVGYQVKSHRGTDLFMHAVSSSRGSYFEKEFREFGELDLDYCEAG
ncbi:MAG: RhuM family protein [Candidatus Wallbacteria bacterium]|nr:RhuM family protein [Candidatus Wallbacteria bacterium]